MRLEHYDQEKLKREVQNIIGRRLDLNKYKVFLFGSRVSGEGDEHSDIDVGIEGEKPVPLSALAAIRDELEEMPVLYKIEVVDFTDADDKFKTIAKKHLETLSN